MRTPPRSARARARARRASHGLHLLRARLVPLQNRNALVFPSTETNDGRVVLKTETEDLRAATLAFVLGMRSENQKPLPLGGDGLPLYNGHNVGQNSRLMPGMAGTERFQQLCSLEYLQAYYKQVFGPPMTYVTLGEDIANVVDTAKLEGMPGSDAQIADEVHQGIFTRDLGPFLKGKGVKTALINCTKDNLPQQKAGDVNAKHVQPYSVSRNMGDEAAFEALEEKLTEVGLTDWRPDGIVLSKGVNDPSDKMSDEYLEARDGQLYNVRVQGPAIGTTWTGERSMETLPMDKVFVVIIADVWFNEGSPEGLKKIQDSCPSCKAYEQYRKDALEKVFDETKFKADQKDVYTGKTKETALLTNFRIEASTSAEMINYSKFKSGQTRASAGSKRRRLDGKSRMGLEICEQFGEYIVGGWQVGNVLDTSASRAAMPQGSNIGVRTAPNSSALNINVNIGWCSADFLCRSYNNAEGAIKPRYVKTAYEQEMMYVNKQMTKEQWKQTKGPLFGKGLPAAPTPIPAV